jgi:glycosyltransferase-like protein
VRIALLTYSTRPRGGVVHTLALAEALADAGEDVTVWSLGRGGDTTFFRAVDPAVRTEIVPLADCDGESVGERILRSIATLRAGVDVTGADIVHAQDCITANAVPDALRTVHHVDHFETPELVACHERAIRTPRGLVCVSAAVAAEVRAGWGRHATVIPNGVDAARFATAAGPAGAAGRAAWRSRIASRYVLSVGGIEPRKGTVDLVDAMAVVGKAAPDVPLVVAGGETLFDYRTYRAEFDRRCLAAGLAPVLLGPVADADLPALVAGAAAFAFPSTREGFGLAAMEAAAAGVPLVMSDLPVLREVFAGAARFATGPAALAAALIDALERPDPVRIAAGRALARHYTWASAAAAHLALYRTLGSA